MNNGEVKRTRKILLAPRTIVRHARRAAAAAAPLNSKWHATERRRKKTQAKINENAYQERCRMATHEKICCFFFVCKMRGIFYGPRTCFVFIVNNIDSRKSARLFLFFFSCVL